MARLARVTIPHLPHHVTQRGNRRQRVFFCDQDRQLYLRILLEQSRKSGVAFWAYCLMDNHVHFIAVPAQEDSLAKTFGETHRRYTSLINRREEWTGYLWQGRFASFPLDEAHLYAAIRYVERNPVVAGLVARAEQFPWSSARAHVSGMPDPLLTRHFVIERIPDWAAFLRSPQDEFTKQFARHEWTGRPFGERAFVERLEQLTGRRLHKRSPGKRRREAELSIVSPI
jgi:putative transposase